MTVESETLAALNEIIRQQREQLDAQQQALQMQREHLEFARGQLDRVERINARAEAIQGRAGRSAKIVLWVLLPLLLVALVAVLWPYIRDFFYLLGR